MTRPAFPSFPSKRDGWIMATIWGTCAITLWAVAAVSADVAAIETWIAIPLALVLCGFLLWLAYGTGYTIGAEVLVARCGPVRVRVALSEIHEVAPSRSPWSAPACSLDRLHVRTRTGPGVLISPLDKAGFLHALVVAAPHLRVEGDRAVSASA